MELNFTGKGSAFYPPFKNTGAYMLSGKALYLIDCGETMFDVLYHKLDLASIEDVYVILTHMHADHVGSLGTLISYFYCLFNKAIHVVYPQETIKQLLTLEGIAHGIPIAPIPLLYELSCKLSEKLLVGCFGDKCM